MNRNNRTWLCSVLFLDIIGYSKLSNARQMTVKQHFSHIVSDAIRNSDKNDCISLDTGDGIALCYLGDPEEALFTAVGLQDAFKNMVPDEDTHFQVRLGINLGPIKIIEDINGQRNTIGDGINVAQRIMDFAMPNQLLVSRSFFEVVSCLSDSHRKMFSYLGSRKDKHVREHEVYEVASPSSHSDSERSVASQREPESEAAATTEQLVSTAPVPCRFSDEVLQAIETELACYVGAIAKILVKKAAGKTDSLDGLYQLLAEDIPGEKEQRKFLGERVPRQGPAPSTSAASDGVVDWDAAVLNTVAEHLTKYLGPIAKILVRKGANKASTLPELYQYLADHIPIEQERAIFLRDVMPCE